MYEIHHLLSVRSSPEKIYQALTTTEGIGSWWSKFVADLEKMDFSAEEKIVGCPENHFRSL